MTAIRQGMVLNVCKPAVERVLHFDAVFPDRVPGGEVVVHGGEPASSVS
jgi:hypothetical protein